MEEIAKGLGAVAVLGAVVIAAFIIWGMIQMGRMRWRERRKG